MKSSLFGRFSTLLCVAALAACAGNATIPASQSAAQPLLAPAAPAAVAADPIARAFVPLAGVRAAGSPCNISGFWYFRGLCAAFYMAKAGGTVALKPFLGVGVTLGFQKNNAPAKTTFIAGDGTSLKNITGTFKGKKFPLYGSIGCVDYYGKATKCTGKALVYFVMINATTTTVKFSGVPSVTVSAATFPGKTCRQNALVPSGNTYVWGWVPSPVAPKRGKVTFPTNGQAQSFPGQNAILISIVCY